MVLPTALHPRDSHTGGVPKRTFCEALPYPKGAKGSCMHGESVAKCGTDTWCAQVVADAAYSEPCDAVLLVAAVRATASMSRNLPTAATGFMTAHIPHLDDDCTPPVSLPQSMQLLFDVAVRSSSACSETEEEEGSQPCRVHASVAKAAMGLISDLAANDEEARISLQGRYAVNVWIGV